MKRKIRSTVVAALVLGSFFAGTSVLFFRCGTMNFAKVIEIFEKCADRENELVAKFETFSLFRNSRFWEGPVFGYYVQIEGEVLQVAGIDCIRGVALDPKAIFPANVPSKSFSKGVFCSEFFLDSIECAGVRISVQSDSLISAFNDSAEILFLNKKVIALRSMYSIRD